MKTDIDSGLLVCKIGFVVNQVTRNKTLLDLKLLIAWDVIISSQEICLQLYVTMYMSTLYKYYVGRIWFLPLAFFFLDNFRVRFRLGAFPFLSLSLTDTVYLLPW